MKTVQMTLEPELVAQVDRVARRRALRAAVDQLRVQELERRHHEGYRRKPVRRGEFDAWTREQSWPD